MPIKYEDTDSFRDWRHNIEKRNKILSLISAYGKTEFDLGGAVSSPHCAEEIEKSMSERRRKTYFELYDEICAHFKYIL